MSVIAPTYLSLALTSIIKDGRIYFKTWKELLDDNASCGFEWWTINGCILFTILSIISVLVYLNSKKRHIKESKTIRALSYQTISNSGREQIISSIIPWLTAFLSNSDFITLFICITIQCFFFAIVNYNDNSYNMICSILGYRYYEVHTEENTYILLSKKCIRNRNEIKEYTEITDYMGLIILK